MFFPIKDCVLSVKVVYNIETIFYRKTRKLIGPTGPDIFYHGQKSFLFKQKLGMILIKNDDLAKIK